MGARSKHALLHRLQQSLAGISDPRAKWDLLNEMQGKLFTENGGAINDTQERIIRLMEPLTPPGYEGR